LETIEIDPVSLLIKSRGLALAVPSGPNNVPS
jgi:hypothetical protein